MCANMEAVGVSVRERGRACGTACVHGGMQQAINPKTTAKTGSRTGAEAVVKTARQHDAVLPSGVHSVRGSGPRRRQSRRQWWCCGASGWPPRWCLPPTHHVRGKLPPSCWNVFFFFFRLPQLVKVIVEIFFRDTNRTAPLVVCLAACAVCHAVRRSTLQIGV